MIEQLASMLEQVRLAMRSIDIAGQTAKLDELENDMARPDFWSDAASAEKISSEAAALRKHVQSWRTLEGDLATTLELAELSKADAEADFDAQMSELQARYDSMMIELKLGGEYDDGPAIVQISAGVGGTDAQDWAQRLLTMYSRYCEKAD